MRCEGGHPSFARRDGSGSLGTDGWCGEASHHHTIRNLGAGSPEMSGEQGSDTSVVERHGGPFGAQGDYDRSLDVGAVPLPLLLRPERPGWSSPNHSTE